MKMKRKLFILLIASAVIFQPIFVMADIGSAKNYLNEQPQDAWITQALIAAGETGFPMDHLTNVSGTLATDYAKTVLALAAANKNPENFSSVDYVAKLKSYYNSNQMGDANLLNDDIWSILALASIKEINSAEALGAKNYLLAHQNSDGGWGYAVGGLSDTNDTAAAIMALVEAGVDINNQTISKGANYLKSAQNSDGGFGYMIGSESDSGSDSWVMSAIYKINENPENWIKNNNNPVSHLMSLQDTDGGFWWIKPGTGDFNNKAMTAFAVIALSGKSFPVGYYGKSNSGKVHLRIEGEANTICDTYADGKTALDVVKNAAESCNYFYTIQDTAYGPYLSKINSEEAAGMSGWMYFVDNKSPSVGAADYNLKEGEEVLWYYGEWGWQPLKLSVDTDSPEAEQNITATVEYNKDGKWTFLEGAKIKGDGNQEYTTDSAGHAVIKLPVGIYDLYAVKTGFVRSDKITIKSGSGALKSIGLVAEVDQGKKGGIAGEAIIFNISKSRLDFAKIKPGGSMEQKLNISNSGTVNLSINASLSGDQLFKENLKINNKIWPDFKTDLKIDENKEIKSVLSIPADYLGSGIKTGELTLWAQAL